MVASPVNLPAGFELDQQGGAPNLPPGFELDNGPQQPQPNPGQAAIDTVGHDAGLSPLGMASSGANGMGQGINKLLDVTGIPVPEGIQKTAQSIFQPFRAAGIGTARYLQNQFTGQPQNDLGRTLSPSYKPQGMAENIGSTIGENAPVVAAGMVSPMFAGPAAMAAQQAQSGKVSPLPLLGPLAEGGSKLAGGENGINKSAAGMARRSIGYPKSMLGTTFARGQAADAAQVALENKIIPWSGNPATTLQRASELANKSGQALGDMRSSVGPQPLDSIFNQLRSLRSRLTQGGAQGGDWDLVHGKIDEAEQTLKGLYGSNSNSPIYESPPEAAVKAKPARILSLPEPRKPLFREGPVNIQPVENVDSDLYMKQYEPGKNPTSADLKRFRNLGWDSVQTTDGATVYADPRYLASLKSDFNMVGESRNTPRNQFNADFPRGNADYYGAEASSPQEPQPRKIDRIDLNAAEAAKNRIGGKLNYQSDLNTQKDTKSITHSIESGIENILRENGVDMKAYREQKRLYGSAESIKKASNKEIAGQEGNKLGRLGMFGAVSEVFSRRLPGTISRTLDAVPGIAKEIKAGSSAIPASKVLTESKAREFWDQAKNEGLTGPDRRKRAEELARQAGHKW